ncbi:MAG: branched-chain amino acid ABC transporter permease [Arenicellales bacterium]
MKISYADVIVWGLLLTAPFWMPWIGGYTALGSRVLVFALAAMGLNLLLGHTGGLSFGHAAYFGLGAYGTGLLLKYLTSSTLLAILGGTALGGAVALLVGPLTVRRRGIYFAMVTIAIGQMIYFIAVRWNSLTGGEDGLTGFSRQPLHFGALTVPLQGMSFYYFVLLFFAVGAGIVALVLRSPLGRTFAAVRSNERRLRFLGISIERYIWASFAISGLIAALAGSLEALLNNFTSPQDLHWTLSGDFVIICVLGGMRSYWGPLVGAIIFVVVQDYLSSLTANWMTFIGLLFVVIVLVFPQGILGFVRRRVST